MIFFLARRRSERGAADRLYAACVEAARRPALYQDYGVPDTLQGRFEMLALHLFVVLDRLVHEPGDDPRLARLVSESFVADMDSAFREMGVGDLSVPKRMKTLYRSFAGRIAAYRGAMAAGDEALVSAVARNIFPDSPVDRRAPALARYLSAAVREVRFAELPRLRRGDVPFPEPVPPDKEEPNP
jgi:cytochrome b pre-mRNA-processing protein 3